MAEIRFDHVGLSKTSRHWPSLSDEDIITQIFRGHFMRQQLDKRMSRNEHDTFLGTFQYEWTNYLSIGNLIGINNGPGRNPSGLGIWTCKRFRGQGNTYLNIATFYRHIPLAHGGGTWSVFYQHLMYFRYTKGIICTRQAFMLDLA